jgi:hypothetical protein
MSDEAHFHLSGYVNNKKIPIMQRWMTHAGFMKNLHTVRKLQYGMACLSLEL